MLIPLRVYLHRNGQGCCRFFAAGLVFALAMILLLWIFPS
jgi:hypothetical protein